MTGLVILIRIVFAALLSGLIGIEREVHGCAAGLRTHILVCIGSTLFMLTSINIAMSHGHVGDVDPSRIAAGVVTGIGFLGAGAIIRFGTSIRGLTTAASIWAVAAIGLAVGAGMYKAAGITTMVALAVLILSRLEERMALNKHGKCLRVSLQAGTETTPDEMKTIIESYGGKVRKTSSKEKDGGGSTEILFDLFLARLHHRDVVVEVSSLPGVDKVDWK